SEEHTSELQSLTNLVCRLLLEKKKDLAPLILIVTEAGGKSTSLNGHATIYEKILLSTKGKIPAEAVRLLRYPSEWSRVISQVTRTCLRTPRNSISRQRSLSWSMTGPLSAHASSTRSTFPRLPPPVRGLPPPSAIPTDSASLFFKCLGSPDESPSPPKRRFPG